jgi:hypothetical protein
MSGHKRLLVSLGVPDSRQLQELYARFTNIERDNEQVRNKILELRSDNFQQSYQRLEDRQEFFVKNIGDLDESLRAVEEKTAQSILLQTSAFQQNFDQLEAYIEQNTEIILKQQAEVIQQILDESQYERQQELIKLYEGINCLYSELQRKEKLALDFLHNSFILLESINVAYNHEELIPGVLSMEAQQLEIAKKNIQEGFYDSGLTISQISFQRLSAARIEMENILLQHDLAYNNTLLKAKQVENEIKNLQEVEPIDLSGESLRATINVDFWSWGNMGGLNREIQRLIHYLERRSENISFIEISKIDSKLNKIINQLPSTIAVARQNILASQIRYNIAECVVEALKEQGFVLYDSYYDGDDQRLPYQTALQNLDGSRVFITVSPSNEEPFTNSIDIISQDYEIRTEHELRQRAAALQKALEVHGLQVSINSPQVKEEPLGTVTSQKKFHRNNSHLLSNKNKYFTRHSD